mmetsp:Transcript_29147/g.48178  ORF Transcript_29147/g.48178 Transcript_29147/m.48178 type:complete len:307 (-) Transcript_29147:92-1012(-)|eukprot:CAMPEP_0119013864 /NCGR_PEP_ID=MMETSP1176-20130426/9138_1 /TAXON_ID=265551 /ORGANISM="Synedropsis recta cf, Strain CCMP1620" /LENGTH=306 /DNA_ID=CAMNT_0006966989 /DNA_START=39 /DNA_END=962 /DNA_ORIENTATION=+
MTSWPWMKGVDVAIADPIEPVCDTDMRLSVKKIVQDNSKHIDQVKSALASDPLYDPNKHDDLWIVRFLLSHKKKPKLAIKAAKTTLLFREEQELDKLDIRSCPPHPHSPNNPNASSRRYVAQLGQDSARFVVPNPKRGVVGFLNIASIDQHKLVAEVNEADWLPAFSYMSEYNHQWLDYVTRTTGRLTKSIRIADLQGISLSGVCLENQKRDGKAMGVMEDCYPQLLEGIFICRSPVWIQIPWRIVRPLMPKRVVDKIDFLAPATNAKERKRLLRYVEEEHLPERFGGKNMTWPVDFLPPSNSYSE